MLRQRAAGADALVTPVVMFVSFYVATLLALPSPAPLASWRGVLAAVVATIAVIALWEGGRWPLGLRARPSAAFRELGAGAGFGAALVLAGAGLVVVSTPLRHVSGNGFPWGEVFAVYVPAAIHEELLFRGYPFQKLLRWHRVTGILLAALVFSALHAWNTGTTLLALANIFLGGILLGLAFERYGRLYFPFGIHLAWNLVSGPLLGHEVSGYRPVTSVLLERGEGAWWMTGGSFGIEGTVWMTVVELAGIVALATSARRRPDAVV